MERSNRWIFENLNRKSPNSWQGRRQRGAVEDALQAVTETARDMEIEFWED